MYFTGGNSYQKFLVFVSRLNLLILNSNKKVTNWILTGIFLEKTKPFDTNLELIMSNLVNSNLKI